MAHHEVIVGNIGTVHSGNWSGAMAAWVEYRNQSKARYGRAAGESVTWFKDGEIYHEYIGTVDQEEHQGE